jgi:hypothetical protein
MISNWSEIDIDAATEPRCNGNRLYIIDSPTVSVFVKDADVVLYESLAYQ